MNHRGTEKLQNFNEMSKGIFAEETVPILQMGQAYRVLVSTCNDKKNDSFFYRSATGEFQKRTFQPYL